MGPYFYRLLAKCSVAAVYIQVVFPLEFIILNGVHLQNEYNILLAKPQRCNHKAFKILKVYYWQWRQGLNYHKLYKFIGIQVGVRRREVLTGVILECI